MIKDTVIKWQQVNMRSKEDKHLPDEHEKIVYYHSNGIHSGIVVKMKDKLTVGSGISKGTEIKTGFLWCYQKDISIPEEV